MKVWPILSGKRLHVSRVIVQQFNLTFLVQDEEERVKMETLCSFLLGKEGNSGYNYIGRVEGRSKEEQLKYRKCESYERIEKIKLYYCFSLII